MSLPSSSSILSSSIRALGLAAALVLGSFSSLTAQGCPSTISITGTPSIGTTVTFTVNGTVGCHSCIWVSKNPGPVQIGPITIPIGLPLLNAVDFGTMPASGTYSVPLQIPNDPNTIGLQFFFTNVSFPSAQMPTMSNVEFSPAVMITLVP